MGFFNKKIKCPHCNKNVDEEYAVNVGICPNCSKILNVKSSSLLAQIYPVPWKNPA